MGCIRRLITSLLVAATAPGAADAWAAPQDGTDALRVALSGALGRIVAARVAVAEFYVTYARPPVSSQEVGLAPASDVEAVAISIESAGVIRVGILDAASTRRARLFLVPQLSQRGLAWSCVSPDIAEIATIVRGCRFETSFEPVPETPASLEAKATPGLAIVTIEGQAFRIFPPSYVSGSTATIDPYSVTGLSVDGRAQLVDAILARAGEHVERLDDLLYLAAWLRTLGPAARPVLERHLDDAPAVSGAALLALCGVGPNRVSHARREPCSAATTPRAEQAIAEINRLTEQQLHDPTDHPHWALRGIVDCQAAIEIVAALGTAARPVARALGALLGDRRPHQEPGGPDLCSQRDIATTLLRILLAEPSDPRYTELADAAALALVQSTLFDASGERDPNPSGLGAVLDAYGVRARILGRLRADISSRVQHCDPVAHTAPALVTDLGVLAFDALLPLLDARAAQPACDPGSAASQALAALVVIYPREAAARFFDTRAVPTRDDIITAAVELREADSSDRTEAIAALLKHTGFTPIAVRDGHVKFPDALQLQWTPSVDWRVPFTGPPATPSALRAAYLQLARGFPQCRIPLGAEAWHSVSQAKRLFVFPCDDEPALIVIGSPAGFKRMHVPQRLAGVTDAPSEAIVGVGDVDGDGNLEVLMAVACDARDAECAEGRVDDTYYFFEEDGDWFTWFRARKDPR